jgi:hypothetical protein
MHSPRNDRVRGRRQRDGFGIYSVAILSVVLVAVATIPILTHPLPPLTDYINHLARTYVVNAIQTDPNLAKFYQIEWQVIPNLMIDLIVPALHRFMDIYTAGEVFTILSFTVIVSGVLALHRVLFGRWSILPLFAVPFLYNGVFLVGVMNYVFGIGLALWALAAWIALRERDLRLRLAVSTLFVVALFFCHLFAAGLYGVALFAFELHRLWQRRAQPMRPLLIDFLATGAPFIAVIVLLFSGPTVGIHEWPPHWQLDGKLYGLTLTVGVYYQEAAIFVFALLVAACAWAWYRGVLRIHPVGLLILAVGFVVFAAMPRSIFGAHLADQRLPIAVLFMFVACIDVRLRSGFARGAVVGVLVALVAARVLEVQVVWDQLEYRTQDFLNSVRMMERGPRILVVRDYDGDTGAISDSDLVHAASLATIERSALVTTAFTVKGKHILQVRPEYRDYVETEDHLPPSVEYFVQVAERADVKSNYFWNLWPRHYDYVYILLTERGDPSPDRKYLTLVHEGPGFQLYRVNRRG